MFWAILFICLICAYIGWIGYMLFDIYRIKKRIRALKDENAQIDEIIHLWATDPAKGDALYDEYKRTH